MIIIVLKSASLDAERAGFMARAPRSSRYERRRDLLRRSRERARVLLGGGRVVAVADVSIEEEASFVTGSL